MRDITKTVLMLDITMTVLMQNAPLIQACSDLHSLVSASFKDFCEIHLRDCPMPIQAPSTADQHRSFSFITKNLQA
eukprot:1161607-Pelagomonas_calceolata.AAC.6